MRVWVGLEGLMHLTFLDVLHVLNVLATGVLVVLFVRRLYQDRKTKGTVRSPAADGAYPPLVNPVPPTPEPPPPPYTLTKAVLVGSNTPTMCTDCRTVDASTYYLKRRRGLYALLCFNNGQGCWERSGRTNCSYMDSFLGQCTLLAEYEVVSEDGLNSRIACREHVSHMLSPGLSGFVIHPLED